MCIIIIIIYTYNINSMPPKTYKYTSPISRHRALSSQWAADNPNPGIINGITTTPPQQHSQIPTTNVQVAEPPAPAPAPAPAPQPPPYPPPGPPPLIGRPPPPPWLAEEPWAGAGGTQAKWRIGQRRPKKGQTAKKPGKKPGKKKLTTDEERERRFNALIQNHQQNADQHNYFMGAIRNQLTVSTQPQNGPERDLPLADPNQPLQNDNTLLSFPELNNNNNNNNNNNTPGGKRRNSVKRKHKSGKRKHKSRRKTKRRK